MDGFLQHAKTCMRMSFGMDEIFHIQLYGGSGIGKTDLSDLLINVLKEELFKQDANIYSKITGLSRLSIFNELYKSNEFGTIYKMNELLKHSDGYFNQPLAQIDETDVFVNPSQESIINKMQILSGQVSITQQADLGSKGRVMEIRVLISNTNNPFIAYQDMLQPKALWRRRMLLNIDVMSDYLNTDGTINDELLLQAGLNRTKCEHLCITWLDPLNPTLTPNSKMPQKMNIHQTIQLCKTMMAKHYSIEISRSIVKNPQGALIRYTYEMLMNTLERNVAPGLPISVMLKTLQERVEQRKVVIRKRESDLKELLKQDHPNFTVCKENFEHLDSVVQLNIDSAQHPGIVEAAAQQIENYPTKTAGVGRMLHYELREVKHAIQGYCYYIFESVHGSLETTRGPIDLSNFRIGSVTHSTPKQCFYMSSTQVTDMSLKETILSYLVEFKLQGLGLTRAYLNKKHMKIRKAPFLAKLKANALYYFEQVKHLVGNTARWVMNMAAAMFQGAAAAIITGLAIVGIFITIEVLARLFSPTETTAYNKKEVARVVIDPVKTSLEVTKLYHDQVYKALYRGKILTLNGLKGNVFYSVDHAFKIVDSSSITIFDPLNNSKKTFPISPKDVIPMSGDACLVVINGFRCTRDMTSHFITDADIHDNFINFRNSSINGLLLRPPSEDSPFGSSFKQEETGFLPTEVKVMREGDSNINVFTTKPKKSIWGGDSGSVAVHDNEKIAGKIVGVIMSKQGVIPTLKGDYEIHVSIITQEMITSALARIQPKYKIVNTIYEGEIITDHELCHVMESQVIRKSPYPSMAVSKESGYSKTPLFGKVPCDAEPAIQHSKDVRIDPGSRHFLKVAINTGRGIVDSVFTKEEEDWCVDYLVSTYRMFIPNLHKVRLYTAMQTITGIKAPGSTSMDLSTSPGLPYKLEQRGHTGKAPFITYNPTVGTYCVQQRLIQDIELAEDFYSRGRILNNFKLQFRKKELVGPSKITDPKTRLVGMGNVVHHIIYMKAFKDLFLFTKNVWNNGGSSPFALGIDPERHWDDVANYLQYHNNILDYDVKAWEEKITQRLLYMSLAAKLKILRAAHEAQQRKFPPDLDLILHSLVVDFADSNVIFEDIVYAKRSGLLSGHPGTFMENSEIHLMIVALIIRRILQGSNPLWATTAFILKHVKILVAADDILLATSPLVSNILTPEAIKSGYKLLDFEITAPDKSPEIKVGTIHTVQFLKTHFNEVDGQFKPLFNRSIVNQLINWARSDSKLTFVQQMSTNFENALRFCFWRGEDEYEELRELINAQCLIHRIPFQHNLSYQEFAPLIRSRLAQLDLESRDENPLNYQCD